MLNSRVSLHAQEPTRRPARVPWIGVLALLLTWILGAAPAPAATLEPVGSFESPIYVTSDPSDAGRLLVVERGGRIMLAGEGEPTVFADLSSLVGCPCQGERGLMSIALAPDFSTSGHLYVFYAREGTGEIHVDELTASG